MSRIAATVAAIVLIVIAPAAPVHADDGAAASLPVLCSLAKALGIELPDCEKLAGP